MLIAVAVAVAVAIAMLKEWKAYSPQWLSHSEGLSGKHDGELKIWEMDMESIDFTSSSCPVKKMRFEGEDLQSPSEHDVFFELGR